MIYIFTGFILGFPLGNYFIYSLGFYCKENNIDPPI